MKHNRRATRQQEAALQLVLQAFKTVGRLPGLEGERPTPWHHGDLTQPLSTEGALMTEFKADEATIKALVETIAVLTNVLAHSMNMEYRQRFLMELADRAAMADADDARLREAMLMELHTAVAVTIPGH